jgi:hypothetical protein
MIPGLFALQGTELWLGMVIAGALFAGLLIPYLLKEIRRGKAELGPSIPTGAGDTHPGYRGNPTPGQPDAQAGSHDANATLSLKSFHLVLISLSIVLASGTGVWGLFNHDIVLGAVSLGLALLLVVYGSYFVWKAENVHLE